MLWVVSSSRISDINMLWVVSSTWISDMNMLCVVNSSGIGKDFTVLFFSKI